MPSMGRFAGAYKSVSVKRSADMLQAILKFILTAHIFRKGTYVDLYGFVRIIKLLLFDLYKYYVAIHREQV